MTQYVYVRSEPQLFTVGFYDPAGRWHSESDHPTPAEAAKRVNYLNGGLPSIDADGHLDRSGHVQEEAQR